MGIRGRGEEKEEEEEEEEEFHLIHAISIKLWNWNGWKMARVPPDQLTGRVWRGCRWGALPSPPRKASPRNG